MEDDLGLRISGMTLSRVLENIERVTKNIATLKTYDESIERDSMLRRSEKYLIELRKVHQDFIEKGRIKINNYIGIIKGDDGTLSIGQALDLLPNFDDNDLDLWILGVKSLLISKNKENIPRVYLLQKLEYMKGKIGHFSEHGWMDFNIKKIYDVLYETHKIR